MSRSTFALQKTVPLTKEEKKELRSSLIGAFVIGILLCCTGIGALIGIPLLLGLLYHGPSKFEAAQLLEGPCPVCGYSLTVPVGTIGANCPACTRRFVIRGHRFEEVA